MTPLLFPSVLAMLCTDVGQFLNNPVGFPSALLFPALLPMDLLFSQASRMALLLIFCVREIPAGCLFGYVTGCLFDYLTSILAE